MDGYKIMSVTITEVIEAGGYDLKTIEDAEWLISQENQFNELLDKAKELVEAEQERLDAIAEAEYQSRCGENE